MSKMSNLMIKKMNEEGEIKFMRTLKKPLIDEREYPPLDDDEKTVYDETFGEQDFDAMNGFDS